MTSASKGVLIGLANVIAVATVFAAIVARQIRITAAGEAFMLVCLLGMVPGIIAGACLGWLAGRLEQWRLFLLSTLAVAGVSVLGHVLLPAMIMPALVPTLVMTFVLERWTRPPTARPGVLRGSTKGAIVALANVFAVVVVTVVVGRLSGERWFHSAGLGRLPDTDGTWLAVRVMLGTVVVGYITGLLLGHLAERLAHRTRLIRFTVIAGSASGVVATLGWVTGCMQFVMPAAVTTLIAAVILEVWTARAPVIPVATAR